MVEAWAGHKSFQAKERWEPPRRDPDGGGVDFRGEKRSNATDRSTTDPDARLYRKTHHGDSKLSYLGHVLMENQNGLVVEARLTPATGMAEREAAMEMAAKRKRGSTMRADKGYDTKDFVLAIRELGIVSHVAQNTKGRRNAIDGRTTRHRGYRISQFVRHRVEPIFGWMKTMGLMHKTRHRGLGRATWMFTFTAAVYNLVCIRNLIVATAENL